METGHIFASKVVLFRRCEAFRLFEELMRVFKRDDRSGITFHWSHTKPTVRNPRKKKLLL